MDLKEILKNQGLTDEQISSIEKEMKDNKVYTTSLENADERYSKAKIKVKDLEKKIEIQDQTIKSFEGGLTKEEAERLVKDNDGKIEAQALQFKKEIATDRLFNEYKFSSENARIGALSQFNKAELKFENDSWVGGKEFLEEMKKNDPNTFQTEQPAPTGGGFNPPGGEPGFKNPYSKENWSLTEQMNLEMSNPTLAAQLRAVE